MSLKNTTWCWKCRCS